MSACVFGSMKLWASAPEAEGYVENVYALERSGNFFMTCGGSSDMCRGACKHCAYVFEGKGGEFGRFGGICPLCGYDYH